MTANDEKEFEAAEDLSRLYGDIESQTTPADLDAAIMAAAHRAVNAKPQAVPRQSFISRWQQPISWAAVLVLSVSVVLVMQTSNEEVHLMDSVNGLPMHLPQSPEVFSAAVEEAELDSQMDLAELPAKKALQHAPTAAFDSAPLPKSSEPQFSAELIAETPAPARLMAPASLAVESSKMEAIGNSNLKQAEGAKDDALEEQLSGFSGVAKKAKRYKGQALAERKSDDFRLNPDDWIRHIEQLKLAGQLDAVEHELIEFSRQFPQHPYTKQNADILQ